MIKNVEALQSFLEITGIDEFPMGIFFSDDKPDEGYSPEINDLPTREKEINNEIEWQGIFSNFSCVLGKIWIARKKETAAYFSAEQFGCPGGAFWLGFLKPQTETINNYVSSGVPGRMEGELYCDSPDNLRKILDYVDPEPAPKKYCIFKPVNKFNKDEIPEFVSFFIRPESLSGLHQLATFVTNDPEAVASPWSSSCGSLVVWPMHYRAKGMNKAVVGGWDPSGRKFYKTDELSFTVPFDMFSEMLARYEESFLMTSTWKNVQKKIKRSKKAWGEV